ncbi:hypothetical protein CISG_05199 [Coccidioides immitis RMSCC 3703]|uniref:Uncharacterized protein n=2 Tax=Coccidioides immitis TaxID=5501 RepID=A0A0J8TPZ3_COCIT|nr:hypothetical protein CIRG_00117 [Coccidioides immitis RMSCC 2394]KMU75802.1 hypothetical protein CISG_05199 [Coccidioides immitis RMSCC 3703]
MSPAQGRMSVKDVCYRLVARNLGLLWYCTKCKDRYALPIIHEKSIFLRSSWKDFWVADWQPIVLHKIWIRLILKACIASETSPISNPWFFWTLLGFLQLFCN